MSRSFSDTYRAVPFSHLHALWALVFLALASLAEGQFAPNAMPLPAVATYDGTVYDSLLQQQTATSRAMLFDSATTFTDESFTTGTYTYTKTGANTAALSYTANTATTGFTETENSTALLTFTSAYGGTYTMSGSYSGVSSGVPFSGTLTNGSGTFTVRTLPTVSTPTQAAVQATTATLGGTVVTDGGTVLSARGVVCCPQSLSSTPYVGGPGMSSFTSPGGTGIYTVNATGLLPGTTYVYRAYAANNVGMAYTSAGTFTTPPAAPAISTPTSGSVTSSSAVLGGNVTSDSGSAITERGVVFAPSLTNGDPLIGGSGVIKAVAAGSTGVFTIPVTLLPATQYSFKAYATNAVGTTYTSPATVFATFAGAPQISAPSTAGLTQTTVTLGGTITSDGGVSVTERGVVLAETAVNGTPALGGSGVSKGTSAGTTGIFSVAFTGLTPNTSYSFRAYGTNMYGTTYTTPVATFTTASGPPLLSTPVSTGITSGSAALGGTVTNNGGASVSECGVVYAPTSVNADPQIGGSGVVRLTTTGATGAFTVNASSLQPGTGYTFRAYAINSFGAGYTAPVSTFTTLALVPTVTTPSSASVTATTATLGGNVTSDGAGGITERGVVYALTATNSSPTIGGAGVVKTTATGTTGIFTAAVTGLTPFSGYSFCAYATNASGTSYSTVSTFTTLASAPSFTAGLPTSTNVMATTADLGGNVLRDNGSPITERGVVFSRTSVNSSPTIGGSGVTKLTTTPDIGTFSITAPGLSTSTGYSFKAYAINSLGTTYTSTGTFTTFTSSAATVTTPTKANVTNTTATLGGNVTSDGHNLITERGVVYSLSVANSDPTIGNIYSTKVPTTGTTGVFTVAVTGLGSNNGYSFKAYAINAAGTSYSAVSTFTTAATGPPVVALAATTQDKLNITLGGNITVQGGLTITERGIVYSKTGVNAAPTIGGTGVTKVASAANVQSGQFTVDLTSLDPYSDYSWRPYAINSAGTAYSPTAGTFSTPAGNPTLATPTSTNVTSTAATLGGSVVTTGGRPITFYAVFYALTSANASPVENGPGVTTVYGTAPFSGPGAFTVNVTGLTPGSQYSFSVMAGQDDGLAQLVPAGTFTTLAGPPVLDSPTASVSSDTNARLGANITSDRGAAITERGVVFAKTSVNVDPVIGGTGVTKRLATSDPGTLNSFYVDMTDLTPNTGYSFKAYATNSAGTTYTSPVTTFSTPTAAPRIDTPTSASITSISAVLGGTVISDGGLPMTRGVVYAPTAVNSTPQLGGTGVLAATVSGTTGVFTVNVTALLPNTAYSFRAYAGNSLNTTYTSPVSTFTTPQGPPVVAQPTVYTLASSTASVGGTLVHTGSTSITQRGVVISPTAINADPFIGGTGVIKIVSSSTGGAGSTIQSGATGLLPGTSYTYKVYATSSLGTGYSIAGTLTTLTAIQSWTQTYFGTTTSTGTAADDADPDKDGLANLIEYAFGLNPLQSASRLLPSPQHNGSTFSLIFTQPAGVSGVTYSAQWSANLQPGGWTDIPDTGSGTTHIFSVPVTPGSGHEARVFIRLSISR